MHNVYAQGRTIAFHRGENVLADCKQGGDLTERRRILCPHSNGSQTKLARKHHWTLPCRGILFPQFAPR